MLHDIPVCPTNDWDTNQIADMFHMRSDVRDAWTAIPSEGRVGQFWDLVEK
jgi:hypothetical protein